MKWSSTDESSWRSFFQSARFWPDPLGLTDTCEEYVSLFVNRKIPYSTRLSLTEQSLHSIGIKNGHVMMTLNKIKDESFWYEFVASAGIDSSFSEQYARQFVRHKVMARRIHSLSSERLINMGISSISHRLLIFHKLRSNCIEGNSDNRLLLVASLDWKIDQLCFELDEMNLGPTCEICMDRGIAIRFQCYHSTCYDCTTKLSECPFCRRPILERTQLLF